LFRSPYTAFCASCGVGLAHDHEAPFADERANYLCLACQTKAAEVQRSDRLFLAPFEAAVRQGLPEAEKDRPLRFPDDAEDVARLDPRRYVAYLAADGNG